MATASPRRDSLSSKKTRSSIDEHSAGDNTSAYAQEKRRSAHAPEELRSKDGVRSPLRKRDAKSNRDFGLQLNESEQGEEEIVRVLTPKSPRTRSDELRRDQKTAKLPPYLRATIAEQLAPVCTRPARENTQETLFGTAEVTTPRPSSSAKSRENTQTTLFGEPEPRTIRKSSRHLADTQSNLFGPPPQILRKQSSRFHTDTPGILSQEGQRPSVKDTELKAIVGRYVLRHQDTHEKLFGAPVPLRIPPPKPMSNVFWPEAAPSAKDKIVKSLPMSSLIADQ